MRSSARAEWNFPAVRMSSSSWLDSTFHLSLSFLCLLATFSLGWVLVTYIQMLRQRASLPPGPFPWPVVGNVLQLSKSKPWLQFKEWSRANNNGLLTIWIGRTPTIVCNDAWSASDLMEKRSSIYSSRPKYVIFGDVTGQSSTNQVFLPYNDHWRLQRKVMVCTKSLRVLIFKFLIKS